MSDTESIELLTPEQVGEALQISKSKVYDLIRRGKIDSMQIGRARRITKSSVQSYLDTLLTNS